MCACDPRAGRLCGTHRREREERRERVRRFCCELAAFVEAERPTDPRETT